MPIHALLSLIAFLFACAEETAALQGDQKDGKAPAPEPGKAKGKVPIPKPIPDPDFSAIQAKPGELVGCPPESTYTRVDLPDGGVEAWCDKNGIKNGSYLKEWPAGNGREKGAYLNGQEDGQWTSWYEHGSTPGTDAKESRGTWDHGKQLGSWTWWWPGGKLKEEGDFLNGRRAGAWVEYSEDGRKSAEGLYVNGEKDGTWTVYKPGSDGVVDHTERYARGQRVDAPAP